MSPTCILRASCIQLSLGDHVPNMVRFPNLDPVSKPGPIPDPNPPLFQQQQQQQLPPPPVTSEPYISQQPTSAPQMFVSPDGRAAQQGTLIGGNRNALNKPYNHPNGRRGWSFGLFDCFSSCETCCYACFCPCFAYGQNMSRLHNLKVQGVPHSKEGELFTAECLTYLAIPDDTIRGFYACIGRKKIRERYNIEGDCWKDCLCHSFCAPCAITQESREIRLEEESLLVVPMRPEQQ